MLLCCYNKEARISFQKITSLELVHTVNELRTVFYENRLKIAGDGICTICLRGFIEGQAVTVISRCRHAFHPDCLNEWLNSDKETRGCPNCQQSDK